MKKIFVVILCLTLLFLASCGGGDADVERRSYMSITAKEAKEIMENETDYIILDVRTQEEFDEGHIPGALLIPDYEVSQRAESELPDKAALILVYCRSGRRSKNSAQTLAELGYTNVKEFGGIIDWEYEIER